MSSFFGHSFHSIKYKNISEFNDLRQFYFQILNISRYVNAMFSSLASSFPNFFPSGIKLSSNKSKYKIRWIILPVALDATQAYAA